ncbi:MAG: hypothetical protein K5829_03655 [Treponema sp.]|nr:hypothetical protein [Treponema sp.]
MKNVLFTSHPVDAGAVRTVLPLLNSSSPSFTLAATSATKMLDAKTAAALIIPTIFLIRKNLV